MRAKGEPSLFLDDGAQHCVRCWFVSDVTVIRVNGNALMCVAIDTGNVQFLAHFDSGIASRQGRRARPAPV